MKSRGPSQQAGRAADRGRAEPGPRHADAAAAQATPADVRRDRAGADDRAKSESARQGARRAPRKQADQDKGSGQVGTQELYVEDAGGQSDGDGICNQEEQNGWTPEGSPGPLAVQAQQQAQQQAQASASASASAAASEAAQQAAQDVTRVNADGQALAADITKYDADVSTAKAALSQVQGEPLCSGGTSDQQTYDDAQNVYDDAQPVYDDEGQMSTDLTAMQSDWSSMVSAYGGQVPSGVGQAEATMQAAEAINPSAFGESAAIQSAATAVETSTGNCG